MAYLGSVQQLARLEKLRKQRNQVDKEQRNLNESVEQRDGIYNHHEEKLWNKLDSRWNELNEEIKELEKHEIKGSVRDPESYDPRGRTMVTKADNFDLSRIIERRKLYEMAEKDDYRFDPNGTDLRDAYNRYLLYGWSGVSHKEARALQADLDFQGGFAATPGQVLPRLIKSIDNEIFFRQYCSVFTIPKAESLGAPEMGTDIGDPTWTSEILTGQEDSDLDFKKRELFPHPGALRIRVSNKFLRVSVIPPEQLITDRFTYKMGAVLETAYMGVAAGESTGVGMPLGVFSASSLGIDTSRDVISHNTSSELKADNLIACVGHLKPQYRRRARWIMHGSTEEAIRKMKDGNGQYFWKQGLEGAPNTILNFPVHLSEYAPDYDDLTSGDYVTILGDFSFYWIIDCLNFQVKRLDELYAETDQTDFICRYEGDGMPVSGRGIC